MVDRESLALHALDEVIPPIPRLQPELAVAAVIVAREVGEQSSELVDDHKHPEDFKHMVLRAKAKFVSSLSAFPAP